MKIVVKKGLDIPIAGRPEGAPQQLPRVPSQIALDLSPFDEVGFKLLVKVGDAVNVGQPLAENKAFPGQMFVSPAGGHVSEIRRGHKRRLLAIVIQVGATEKFEEYGTHNPQQISREELLCLFSRSGLFSHIRLRPFNLIPDPKIVPRAIFVTAIDSRPFAPPYEMQLQGHEAYFQAGLDALSQLTSGRVHLVYRYKSPCTAFTEARNVEKHEALGPHPVGNSSLHIHKIAPIRTPEDYVWSLTALDVLIIGKMVVEGHYWTERLISLAGSGLLKERRGFFRARMGYPVKDLIENRLPNQWLRLISGDPLTGSRVEPSDFLGFEHRSLCAIPENDKREPFHFLRLGVRKFSATRAYLSGRLPTPKEGYVLTTSQHGEERAFVDATIYNRVMPMRIPTAFLIKAILAEDFETAERLGLLEVVPEDFALPAFIDPSKIDMMEIVKGGLSRYAKEMGH